MRSTGRPVVVTIAFVAVIIGLLGGTGLAAATAADEPVPGRLLLLLDASGSMKAKDPSGLTKIEAAKKALTGVVGALPDTAQVGLRVYGATVDGKGKPTPAACADTRLVSPIGPLDKARLTSSIAAVKALGETPIAGSLTAAMTDLGTTGKRNIVLVSDGEESCVPDPCPVVKKLTAAGIDLQIDTVGFGVNAKARAQLQCIANAGNGTYYDARNSDQLTASLSKLSQRALRPFTVSGKPVRATTTAESAPMLTPGQYTDSFATDEGARYYRVKRTAGSTTLLSVTTRPGPTPDAYNSEALRIVVTLPTGRECRRESGIRFGGTGSVVTAVRVLGPEDADDKDPCHNATDLVVQVARSKGAPGTTPAEVLLVEEPPVTDSASLPPAVEPTAVPPLVAPAEGAGRPVTGGGGFSDALTLTPGTYSDVILPDEQIYYRVRADFGQRLAFTVDAPTPGQKLELGSTSYTRFNVGVWNPWRYPLTRTSGSDPSNSGSLGPSGSPVMIGEYTPEIRYNNRTAFGNGAYSFVPLRQVTGAGYYYFAVQRSAEKAGEDSAAPVTVRIRVAVQGSVTGTPTYAGPSPDVAGSPSASPTASPRSSPSPSSDAAEAAGATPDDEGSSPLLWVGAGLVLVAALAAVAAGLLRRRNTAAPGTQGDRPTGGEPLA